MPRALEPGLIFPIVLEGDRGKDPQPTFLAKSLSIRGQRRLLECVERIQAASNKGEVIEAAVEAVASGLVGWRHMVDPATGQEIPYSSDALCEVLAIDELMEIIGKLIGAGQLSEDERKKSASQPS